jgi:hypothetical protein
VAASVRDNQKGRTDFLVPLYQLFEEFSSHLVSCIVIAELSGLSAHESINSDCGGRERWGDAPHMNRQQLGLFARAADGGQRVRKGQNVI